jgi:hypothetical protein|tara:strand:+ start:898 stop:1074 length:177 start_codon:yes stop_codon:yes gene_type:complete
MSEKLKDIAKRAPPIPSVLHGILHFLDCNIKKPLQGTFVDLYVFEPAKKYYIEAKRLD